MNIDYIEIRKTLSKKKDNVERYKYLSELYDSYQNDDKKEFLLWFEHEFLNNLNSVVRKYSKILNESSHIVNYYESQYDFYHSWICEIKQKPKGNDSNNEFPKLKDSPFISIDDFNLFKVLDEGFNEKDKKKWTILYDYLKDVHKVELTQKPYFEFISKFYQVVASRKQESVYSENYYQKLDSILTNRD
jgi:hypothetical protein